VPKLANVPDFLSDGGILVIVVVKGGNGDAVVGLGDPQPLFAQLGQEEEEEETAADKATDHKPSFQVQGNDVECCALEKA
jgi:hypothetical protein